MSSKFTLKKRQTSSDNWRASSYSIYSSSAAAACWSLSSSYISSMMAHWVHHSSFFATSLRRSEFGFLGAMLTMGSSAPLVSSGALATGSSNFHWRQMLILLQLLVSRKIVPKLHLHSFFFFAAIPDQAPTRLLSKQCSSMRNSLTHSVRALPRWVKEIFFLTFFLAYEQQEYHKRWIRLRLHHRCCCCYVSSTRQWWVMTQNPKP
jgi:hypothetical protein